MKIIKCPHYSGDGMMFEYKDYTLLVCTKCWRKMKVDTLEQIKLEAILDIVEDE